MNSPLHGLDPCTDHSVPESAKPPSNGGGGASIKATLRARAEGLTLCETLKDDPLNMGQVHEGGVDVPVALPALMNVVSVLQRGPRAHSEVDDWDILFEAVTSRLRQAVGHPATGEHAPSPATSPIEVIVMECVDALDHLHRAQVQERVHRHQLELQITDAQNALARACAEVLSLQAGERHAQHRALHDGLTELPNRSFFRQRLDDALAQAEPQRQALAVLYLDLDGFKPINDRHGHAVGDEVLRIVAARLSRAVRTEDMVCRLGGDEFACMLSNLPSRVQLGQLARKLFAGVSAPLKVGALELSVRPSIGIATFPVDGMSFDALLKSADAAMYSAKLRHSGYAFCDTKPRL